MTTRGGSGIALPQNLRGMSNCQQPARADPVPNPDTPAELPSLARGRIVAPTWSYGPLQRSAPRLSLPALSARLDDG